MLVCSPTGYIYFISKSYPGKIFKLKIIYIGSNNDIGIYKLYENLIHKHLDKMKLFVQMQDIKDYKHFIQLYYYLLM